MSRTNFLVRETINGTKVRIIKEMSPGIYLVEALTKRNGAFVTLVAENGLKK
jgi:hypothetical protein